MARKRFNFDQIADGADFTTPTPAGGTSNAFTGVSLASAAAAAKRVDADKPTSTPSGTGAIKLVKTDADTTAGAAFMYDDLDTGASFAWIGRLRFGGGALPAAGINFLWVGVGTNVCASVQYLGSAAPGKVRLFNATSGNAWTSSVDIPPNAIAALLVIPGTATAAPFDGQARLDLYSPDGTLLDSSGLITNFNARTSALTRWRAGATVTGNTNNAGISFSNVVVDSAPAGRLVPADMAPQPVYDAGADQTDVEPLSTVTLTGSGTNNPSSYPWTQVSGPAVTLSGTGANRTFTAPAAIAGATLVFDLGGDQVTISVLPQTRWLTGTNGTLRPLRPTVLTKVT